MEFVFTGKHATGEFSVVEAPFVSSARQEDDLVGNVDPTQELADLNGDPSQHDSDTHPESDSPNPLGSKRKHEEKEKKGKRVKRGNDMVHEIAASMHYGRGKIPRVLLASPSAKNRALEKENLSRVLHSVKNCTRGREAFPSAAEILTLGKEQHSAKALFPECNTRGRSALGKETCYLTVHPAHAVKT